MNGQCVEKCQQPYNYFYNDTQICSDHCDESEPVLIEEQLYQCQYCIGGYKFDEQLQACKIDHDNNKSLDKTAIILLSTLFLVILIVIVIMVVMKIYRVKRQKQLNKLYRLQELSELAQNDSDSESTSQKETISSDTSAVEITERQLDYFFDKRIKGNRSSDIIIYDSNREMYC